MHKKDWTQAASSTSSVHARLNQEAELASRLAQQAIYRDVSIIASGVEKHALPGSSLPSARYRQVCIVVVFYKYNNYKKCNNCKGGFRV